jgi:hypothetical protein
MATTQPITETPIEIKTHLPPSATPEPPATLLPIVTVPSGLVYVLDSDSCGGEKGTWVTNAAGQPALITKYEWVNFSPDYQKATGEMCGTKGLIDIKSGEITSIDTDASGYTWSINGQYIYYEKYENNNTDIWVFDTRTNEKRNLTNTPNRFESQPIQWSSNPDTLLFYSWSNQEAEGIGEGWIGHLSSIKTDGSQYSVISNSSLNGYPAISPVGPSIIFSIHDYDANGNYHVKTLFFQLGRSSQPFPFQNYHLAEIEETYLLDSSWSSDGKYLAGWLAGTKNGESFGAIAIINWETGQSKTFFHDSSLYNGPSSIDWSPDSQYTTFYARKNENGKYGVWVWKVDDETPFQLVATDNNFDWCDKAWSPDSKWLALSCDDPAIEPGIWLVEVGKWQLMKTNLPIEAKIQEWINNSILAP